MRSQAVDRRPSPARARPEDRTGRRPSLWITLALFLATVAVYAPVYHCDFVNFDDPAMVTRDPHVSAGLTREGFVWAWTAIQLGNRHPLTTLSHMLDCQLFGLNPGAHHLVNVGFHVLNTLLLFGVLARMTARPWRSACVAALFALHPLHVESVAWVSERKDVLSTFFWMLTLWAYVAYVQRHGRRRYIVVMIAFVAALLSKPMVVTLPLVLLLLDLWPLDRVSFKRPAPSPPPKRRRSGRAATGPPSGDSAASAVGRLVLEKVPLFLLSGIAGVIAAFAQQQVGALKATLPFSARGTNAVVSYATYLVQMVWPTRLAALYIFEWPIPLWQVVGSSALLIGVSGLVAWGGRRHPYLLVGWLWYLGTLVPVIGLIHFGIQAMADRYTYVPLIGIFIIAAWGIPDLLAGWRYQRVVCAAAAVLALAACSVLTARQLQFWRDTMTLFQRAVDVTRNNFVAHATIGELVMAQERRDEAFYHFSEVLRIADRFSPVEPFYSEAHYNVGLILAARGDIEGAKQHYLSALRMNPTHARTHGGLAFVLAAQGDTDGALAEYREAIRLDPDFVSAHTNLAITLENLGQTTEAITHYAAAARLEPERAESRANLAAALANADRLPEAIEEFRAALQRKPQLAEARFGLASAEAQAGQVPQAVAELDALLRERPDWTAVEATLAWLLATAEDAGVRNGVRAVQVAEDAARRTENHDPDVLNSLAAGYAEVGRFTDATDTAAQALELARAAQRTALITALGERLAQYRAGQPAREPARDHHQ
jgi:tetratricopeptide (TPR) repeat protein